eukprot:381018-Hanusia_phi.AAC.1
MLCLEPRRKDQHRGRDVEDGYKGEWRMEESGAVNWEGGGGNLRKCHGRARWRKEVEKEDRQGTREEVSGDREEGDWVRMEVGRREPGTHGGKEIRRASGGSRERGTKKSAGVLKKIKEAEEEW